MAADRLAATTARTKSNGDGKEKERGKKNGRIKGKKEGRAMGITVFEIETSIGTRGKVDASTFNDPCSCNFVKSDGRNDTLTRSSNYYTV